MKENTARTLCVGSRVTWDNNPKDCGTVVETGYNAVKVKWDDASQGEISILYFTEMANIGLGEPTSKPRPENLPRSEVDI